MAAAQSQVASHTSQVGTAESAVRSPQSGLREPQAALSPSKGAIPEALSRRVVIDRLEPEIDGGRFPIKRTIGEPVDVTATVFADGHDVLVAVLRDRHQHEGFGIRDSGFGTEDPERISERIPERI